MRFIALDPESIVPFQVSVEVRAWHYFITWDVRQRRREAIFS